MANLANIARKSKASQGTKELEWLLIKLNDIKPKVIVEIGVHLGHSLKVWQDAFKPDILIGIDNESNIILEKYLLNELSNASFMLMDSHYESTLDHLIGALRDNPIDFLFIDGDHTYEGVKQDFEMYSPLVREGGIIAFDDMAIEDNESVKVYKFWPEVQESRESAWIKADSNGIGLIYV